VLGIVGRDRVEAFEDVPQGMLVGFEQLDEPHVLAVLDAVVQRLGVGELALVDFAERAVGEEVVAAQARVGVRA